jgi:hypothetical protein
LILKRRLPEVDPARNISQGFAKGEKVEGELDILIARRHEKRARSEGDRRAQEMYEESVRVDNPQREQERRAERADYHRQQAARLRATLTDLVAHHEAQAARYRENRP